MCESDDDCKAVDIEAFFHYASNAYAASMYQTTLYGNQTKHIQWSTQLETNQNDLDNDDEKVNIKMRTEHIKIRTIMSLLSISK